MNTRINKQLAKYRRQYRRYLKMAEFKQAVHQHQTHLIIASIGMALALSGIVALCIGSALRKEQ